MKKFLPLLLLAGLTTFSAVHLAAQEEPKKKGKKGASAAATESAPKSVIHVVTVKWKDGTTEEQIKAALDGVKALPKAYPGITRVWTRSFKVQNPSEVKEKKRTHAFVMEFANEKALTDYHNSPAQLEWYKTYEDIRDQSTTFDITN
jgi:hypothetical protein